MAEREHRMFVYGSLLPGQSNHAVAAGHIRQAVPGVVHGRLVDCGAYPALVRDGLAQAQGAHVRGLWITVGDRGLRAMDALEEYEGAEEVNDYARVWTADAEFPDRAGWVYVWEGPRDRPAIRETYWPDYTARKRMDRA
ncbi:gamma-glutamylcyclotransferase family protein [Paenibacillus sp. GCM10023250]|uniref:gamma-glutamylcyclotransferase family protein n=1 Tax=Paenibacillus sp. GCM10023250 TaxID=3252648 RepID=UPI0036085B5B